MNNFIQKINNNLEKTPTDETLPKISFNKYSLPDLTCAID